MCYCVGGVIILGSVGVGVGGVIIIGGVGGVELECGQAHLHQFATPIFGLLTGVVIVGVAGVIIIGGVGVGVGVNVGVPFTWCDP